MYRFILLLLATQPLAYQALRDPNILAPYCDNFRSSPTASPTEAYLTPYPTGLYFTAGWASTDATCSACAATGFKVGDNSLRSTANARLNAKRQAPYAQLFL